ncbi:MULTISPECIES: DNA polymerase III subunit alpha [unclassified Mucilaginibacter]|uniref:DNA polymerase III subunit alpha n=1 Tax=unclassified Mucilaginibacter TaxID=2617802 RepID=UPI002AC93C65|nr:MULTISPECIES: DNA polymerase III subunit alpha [unclassified Mucilaginibacter]MEB0262974.1 DNA polymerase III subunit alpha [Mucilaginibacter sp. 10I4]MEB0277531.1 DNA polymerase III subunit alpha [Mucilaginibacter sp. 10B2]MEB0299446.1 DNA polymerase III subunit alpha [Mucilaginibacter sp. 5C4]WPX24839.1 DNA polymerase III subunit alpha [Mucilaginibacter sp. 5C4]
MPEFSHLHVHTQFSLLDGAADISKLYKKAAADGMKALAITDHGNMFGAFKFVAEAGKHNVKPIVGCEFYVVDDRHKKQFTKEKRDKRYHQLMLAKNAEGYKNLIKLCSLGYMEGLYSKWPRIDKELILKYHKGIIATTCCLGASVPQAILRDGEAAAEIEFKWWLDLFGEDFYIEMQRHDIPEQNTVNLVLAKFAKKYNVKVICSNDSHYVDQQDSNAHDILLCVNTGDLQSTPIATDEEGGKGYRFGFTNDQFYFKTQAEMSKLFSDIPESLDNTQEIVDKVDVLKLKRDILLPNFVIPEKFKIHTTADADTLNQWEYLKHLTYMGAKERYIDISPEAEERIEFELFTIRTMGFAGYFLIVADFIRHGRDIGVFIGPGRGSAAGSVVAYCTGITNIDPLKYNLLFERFLNPDRKSMPDIDTDFDDAGRQKVIDYVVDKYGKNQVAQIITYGSMAARTSIQDVGRVLDMPLSDVNAMKKLVPDTLGINLKTAIEQVPELQAIYKSADLKGIVLREAEKLEGSVRNTGVHAAGIIIAPYDLTEIVPVATAKDSDLLVTQYDGRVIEDAGVIKMDFLGLKTLTIIKDALRLIKQNHDVHIDIDYIPLDDEQTYELYQRGDTNGTFQFESDGMQMYLRDLKPDKFEDLIAMNALYRPGPIEYIPNFIKRKHGLEPIVFDLADMEEYLGETYGITVYQEQVMLLSQKLAGFSKGDADVLRKAMGKKQIEVLNKMEAQFMDGAIAKGHPKDKLTKIWNDWKAFAQYAFNKSHSTCYAFVAYQTAYLKAHYPAEYMAAVLNNQNNMEKITFFMEECRRMGVEVLGPDINESDLAFTANRKGVIRFGLTGVKGVGEKAVESIIEERKERGPYKTVYDFAQRSNTRSVNRKSYENLVYGGAFDEFGLNRAQFFAKTENGILSGVERLIKYGNDYQNTQSSSQSSLFGGSVASYIPEPAMPEAEEWPLIEKLKYEKDVIGIYLTGHPLDNFKLEMDKYCNTSITELKNIQKARSGEGGEEVMENLANLRKRGEINIGGLVANVQHKTTKMGKPFGTFVLEDYNESYEFAFFGEDYVKFRNMMVDGYFLHVKGSIEEKFRQKDNWDLRVTVMSLLSEMRDKLTKSLTVCLDVKALNNQLLDSLMQVITTNNEKYPAKSCALKFKIRDGEEAMYVDLLSKSHKVSPSDELMADIFSLTNAHAVLM